MGSTELLNGRKLGKAAIDENGDVFRSVLDYHRPIKSFDHNNVFRRNRFRSGGGTVSRKYIHLVSDPFMAQLNSSECLKSAYISLKPSQHTPPLSKNNKWKRLLFH
jgi:hypothetical protein